MRADEVLVRALLGCILLFIITVIAAALGNSGAEPHIIVLWCIILLLIGATIGTVMDVTPKSWRAPLIVIALILFLATIMLQNKLIPVCGDAICSSGECSRCAADCRPGDCQDGTCQLAIERCDNSKDCSCASGLACGPGRKDANEYGCVAVKCGDGACDAPETNQNCCTDCKCNPGYSCQSNNVCFFEIPRVGITPYRLTDTISALSLAGNPELTDEQGTGRALMAVRLNPTKTIQDVRVTFVIHGARNTYNVGTVYDEHEAIVGWIKPHGDFLNQTEDLRTNATIIVQYVDALGSNYTINRTYPMTLTSRNTLDQYGHIVLFVTNTSVPGNTPEDIWNNIRKSVTLQHRAGTRIQFPIETLRKGTGAPRDIAVLLTSALLQANIRASIVDTPDGYLVRTRVGDRFVMLDPALIQNNFNDAIASRPGYAIYEPDKVRDARNFTTISIG